MAMRLRHPKGTLKWAVVKRVLSILVVLAVLLMPAGMSGGAAAMAAAPESTAAMGHCADMPEPDDNKAPESCCIVACSALLDGESALAAPPAPAPAYETEIRVVRHGLPAEAATPPPRFS